MQEQLLLPALLTLLRCPVRQAPLLLLLLLTGADQLPVKAVTVLLLSAVPAVPAVGEVPGVNTS